MAAQNQSARYLYYRQTEGRELNLEARGKDYATNILSYPSDLPVAIIDLMPTLPLGELIICHEVVVREAAEQDKTVAQHISHLLVHGMLHLLGFDHELGQAEQEEMQVLEIEILASLNLPNPIYQTLEFDEMVLDRTNPLEQALNNQPLFSL